MSSKFLILFILIQTIYLHGQRKIGATDTLFIKGKIKKEKAYTLMQLTSFPDAVFPDQIVYNHKGEIKDTLKHLRGFSVKRIFESIEFDLDKPRDLDQFYFVFAASDGHKVVFSYNEIFNSEKGDTFIIITEMDGIQLKDLSERILFMATKDLRAGPRYIRGLKTITIKSAD